MSRRLFVAAALVAFAALAGCSSLTGSATDSVPPETDPVETPSVSPTASPGPTAASAPRTASPTATPDAADDGRVQRMIDAHSDALGAYDYDLTHSEMRRLTTPNETRFGNETIHVRSSAVADRSLADLSVTRKFGPNVSRERTRTFIAGDTAFRRHVSADGETEYARESLGQRHQSVHESVATGTIETILARGSYENVSTLERGDRTLYRHELDGLRNGTFLTTTAAENATGYYLIDRDGIIHEARLSYDLAGENATGTMSVDLYFAVDVADRLAVERPDWVAEAAEATDDRPPASTSSNRTASAGGAS